jgi:hypothetical protein
MLDMRVTGQYHAVQDVTERYRNIALQGWQGKLSNKLLISHVENKVKPLFAASSNSSGWRFDPQAVFRFLLFLILLLLPGSVFVLPLWWWLARHRPAQTRGAH